MQKGQKVPEHVKEAHKKALHQNFLKTLNFEPVEQYADIQILENDNPKSNLTLRQYFDLVNSGLSAKDVIKQGHDKHLISFFNNLLKGKINITKDEFEKLYLEGNSMDDIAKQFDIPKENMRHLRQMFNIKRKGATYIKRKQTEKPLTQRQKEIVYGTLMGDGGRMSPSSLKIKHSVKQRSYVMWKLNELQEHVTIKSIQEESCFDIRYNKTYTMLRFYTSANTDIETVNNQFYKTGKKVITQEILDNLTPLSLAVWYMDDGTTLWQKKEKNVNANPECRICTDSFSLSECELICNWLSSRFGIVAHTRERGKTKQHRVILRAETVNKFLDLIRPYIIVDMLYKVDYNAWKEKRI